MASMLESHLNLLSSKLKSDNFSTDADLTNLPNQIFESFLPGYSIISKLLLQVFGIDASRLIPSLAITVAAAVGANYLYNHAYRLIQTHLTACVVIESGDDFYEYVTAWISNHPVSHKTRSLKVRNGRSFVQEGQIDIGSGDSHQDTGFINLKNWEAKLSPHFEPLTTSGWFWHNGRYFQFTMSEKTQSMRESGEYGTWIHHKDQVTIVVLGRSPQPIKDLLLEAREIHLEHRSQMTTIRRPVHARMRYYDDLWQKIASRPSRPLDTVVLHRPEKQKLLADVNEYLQPATRQWYAERGIPYRRGYLLYGPPGTGKTSLSFALAGVFGVDIYSLSLLDPGINDEDVNSLMSGLPKHCIILLEDIDSAGLKRGGDDDDEDSDDDSDKKDKLSESTKTKQERNKRVSLSGLLNAIDGVASHEGRILIMTTNNPELLDPALTRPGRVDMKVEFTLSSREQIKELFLRMYSGSKLSSCLTSEHGDDNDDTASVNLEGLALEFAEKLPDQVLSPAEVMGYLLLRKKEPQRAVAEADAWRDEVLAEK